jgi:ADP-heptose:LPS heptosyltransferase
LVSEPTALPVLNPCGCPFDIAVTASLVASVDLVITVDTMIVHLAGAMNKPTWLLLKSEPDWRWDPAVSRSPWYPSLRLFVQHRAGDWSRVVRALEQELVKGEANHAQPAGPVRTRLLG